LIIFSISFISTFLLIKNKDKINLIANPNHRSIHKKSTPNSGGIAMFISFISGIYLFNINIGNEIIISISLIFLFGLYDDIYAAKVKEKILILFIIGNILFFNNYDMQYLGTYMGYSIELAPFFAYLFLVFVIIGFVNSVNLIDGLDGLLSVVAIIILGSFLYIGLKVKDDFLIYIPSIYIFSILGYLYFNWSPAKIFMGDNGSLPIGLIIAIVSIHAVNMGYITPISILMLAALPILDTSIVMSKRISAGVNPFVADKSHIHHFIYKIQRYNTQRTVFILGLIQLFLSYIALGFKIKDDILILGLFILLFSIFYFLLTPYQKK
jgi:UDP-GlcNAc:undecaprenyl-phosphate GlcNAc-1-phosphate transferase